MKSFDRLPAINPAFDRIREQVQQTWARFVLGKMEALTKMMGTIHCNGHTLNPERDLPEVMDRLCGITYIPRNGETCEGVFASNSHSVITIMCAEQSKRIFRNEEVVEHVRSRAQFRMANATPSN